MTSKEALEKLGRINLGDNPYCIFEDNLLKNCCKEEYEKIKKDLEVLEILKKYIYYSEKSHRIRMREIRKSIYNFDYEDLKEWLENENKDTKNI